MEAKMYIGISLEWDYLAMTVILSMHNYVYKAVHKFQHIFPNRVEYSPYESAPIQYDQKIQ